MRYTTDQLVDTLRFPTGSGTNLKLHPSDYSSLQRPESLTVYTGSSILQRWSYGYDAAGRLVTIDSGYDKDYVARVLTYDARGRLASYADHHHYADSTETCPNHEIFCDDPIEDYTWSDDVIRSTTYSPDNSGNRTDHSAVLSNDRLSSMTGADGRSYTFAYDNEGRRTSKTATGYSQTYGWNDLGELIWVKTNGDSVAYGYDAEGRRVRKWHASATTEYLWDGDQLLMELDGSGNRVREYSYQAGIDQPVAVKTSAGTYYYQLDATGSVGTVWNSSNGVAATYTYDPYGYVVASSGTLSQPLQWKGREYDSETGLYYIRARYYDPSVGRFISEDPAGLAGGINPYAFASGEPVNRVDPTGLVSCPEVPQDCPVDLQGELILADPSPLTTNEMLAMYDFALGDWGASVTSFSQRSEGTGGGASPARATFRVVFLPSNPQSCSGKGGEFYAPPGFSISKIVAAGRAGGWSPFAAFAAVGHNGTFDFQRSRDSHGNTTFYKGYTPVANIAVGAYLYGAGFDRGTADLISNMFARTMSSNAGDPEQALYRHIGYDMAAAGWEASCTPNF